MFEDKFQKENNFSRVNYISIIYLYLGIVNSLTNAFVTHIIETASAKRNS